MKISILSTYPPLKCGIAYYTRDLLGALAEEKDLAIAVLSSGNGAKVGDKLEVIHSWELDRPFSLFSVIRNINTLKPEVVHIQFHPGLYGRPVFSTIFITCILFYLSLFRKKVVITFHTIPIINKLSRGVAFRFLVRCFIKLFILLSNKVIVHTQNQKTLLTETYHIAGSKVVIVPIGVGEKSVVRPEELDKFVRQNNLNDKFVILSCPHLRFGLELEYVIEAMAQCSDQEILLVINGLYPTAINRGIRYLDELTELREKLVLGERIKFITDRNMWEETRLLWCQAASLIIYSHSDYSSEDSSMSLGEALSLFKPLLVFDVSKFSDVAAALKENSLPELVVPNLEPAQKIIYIRDSFLKVKNNYPRYRDTMGKVFKSFVEERSWEKSAHKLAKVYREML